MTLADEAAWMLAQETARESTKEIVAELVEALEMVRDADNDCERDDLRTIPPMPRAKIDRAIATGREFLK